MLASSVFTFLLAIIPAVAALTDEQLLSYEGISNGGLPYPYICDELAPKIAGNYDDLPQEDQKKWARFYYSIMPLVQLRFDTIARKHEQDFDKCIGLGPEAGIYDVYDLFDEEVRGAMKKERKEYRVRVQQEVNDARARKGLAPFKSE